MTICSRAVPFNCDPTDFPTCLFLLDASATVNGAAFEILPISQRSVGNGPRTDDFLPFHVEDEIGCRHAAPPDKHENQLFVQPADIGKTEELDKLDVNEMIFLREDRDLTGRSRLPRREDSPCWETSAPRPASCPVASLSWCFSSTDPGDRARNEPSWAPTSNPVASPANRGQRSPRPEPQ